MQDNRIFTNIPYQSKYNSKNVTNDTINILAEKLTRNQGFFNKIRMEKRLKNFLNILDYKLKQDNIDKEKFIKLYNYFNKIYEKYEDELSTILSSNPNRIRDIKEKLENTKRKLIPKQNDVNSFIKGYLSNPNRNVKLKDLENYLSIIIDLAKKEDNLENFNQLRDKYYFLLSLYKQTFSKNNNNSFLNKSKKSFEQLQQNKFPKIFQPSQ